MRKSYDKKFKAKVALEAIKENSTLQELANKFTVHPNQVALWKKQAIENLPNLFERSNAKNLLEKGDEEEKDLLFKTVGEMKIENDFLKKKCRQLYGKEPF
jgi:transposase-like protein